VWLFFLMARRAFVEEFDLLALRGTLPIRVSQDIGSIIFKVRLFHVNDGWFKCLTLTMM
jgi:hypothetical protein